MVVSGKIMHTKLAAIHSDENNSKVAVQLDVNIVATIVIPKPQVNTEWLAASNIN